MNFTQVKAQNCAEDCLVTVFCAVWHLQKNKLELLSSHYNNLKRQTVDVRIIYIFDNEDGVPDWLDADCYVFSQPLSIYEAWSAAVALANSQFIMNLNMDDRLASNAIELLIGVACASSAYLIGGEWLIAFSDDHLNENFSAPVLSYSQFQPDWPPIPQERLRLGSGTGERGTFGPATFWHSNALGKYYPSYFGDGSKIMSVGDSIAWQMIERKQLRCIRLPLIIGIYRSNPSQQAEFRHNSDGEMLKRYGVSTVSFADKILSGEISRAL